MSFIECCGPVPRAGARGGEKAMAGSDIIHVFEYPSGGARFYISDDFVYSMEGRAVYWISGEFWYPYPQTGTAAFWVNDNFIYEYPASGTPKYYIP
jgi:hypothetical protein